LHTNDCVIHLKQPSFPMFDIILQIQRKHFHLLSFCFLPCWRCGIEFDSSCGCRLTAVLALLERCSSLKAELAGAQKSGEEQEGRHMDRIMALLQRSTAAKAEVALLKAEVAEQREEKRRNEEEKQELREAWWGTATDYRYGPCDLASKLLSGCFSCPTLGLFLIPVLS